MEVSMKDATKESHPAWKSEDERFANASAHVGASHPSANDRIPLPQLDARNAGDGEVNNGKGSAWSASPAAGRCMSGSPFVLDGRIAHVEERYASEAGLHSDVLCIRFEGHCGAGEPGILATTVKSLEDRIADGRVRFLESATAFNAEQGWLAGHDCFNPNFGSRRRRFAELAERVDQMGQFDRIGDDFAIRAVPQATTVQPSAYETHRSDRRTAPGPASFLAILTSKPWRSITEVRDQLWKDWQPEWGTRPSDSTVRRWVRKSTAHAPAGRSAFYLRDLKWD
jgi:hypothetical protein